MDDSQGLSSATWDLTDLASGADLVRAPLLRTSIDPQGLGCVAGFEGRPTPHCRMARGRRGRWTSETMETDTLGALKIQQFSRGTRYIGWAWLGHFPVRKGFNLLEVTEKSAGLLNAGFFFG